MIASLRAGHFQLLGNQLTHSATAEATLLLPLCSVSEHLVKPNTKGPLFHRQREKVHKVMWPQESLLLSPIPALSFAPAEVPRPQPKVAVPRLCCSPQARIGSTSSHPWGILLVTKADFGIKYVIEPNNASLAKCAPAHRGPTGNKLKCHFFFYWSSSK